MNDDGKPGTIDQKPRWEGPPENRPRGYLPAKDNPEVDRDAAGENVTDRSGLNDAFKVKGDTTEVATLVRKLSEGSDLSPAQARDLIAKHGTDLDRLRKAARTFKAES